MIQGWSDFLQEQANTADLAPWSDILPATYRVLGLNLFADTFLADAAGEVHMLEVAVGSIKRIATSEMEFRNRCSDDQEGWLLRPLARQCRAAGLFPNETQCYAFTTLPLLGGDYDIGNVWLCSWSEWISFTGSIYAQTKGLADGTKIRLALANPN